MNTLSISLPDRLDAYVAEKVASGSYSSASEVVREGLRLLQQYENARLGAPGAAVQVGFDSLDRGERLSMKAVRSKIFGRRKTVARRK